MTTIYKGKLSVIWQCLMLMGRVIIYKGNPENLFVILDETTEEDGRFEVINGGKA